MSGLDQVAALAVALIAFAWFAACCLLTWCDR